MTAKPLLIAVGKEGKRMATQMVDVEVGIPLEEIEPEIAPVEIDPAREAPEVVERVAKKRPWVMSYFRGSEKTGWKCHPPWLKDLEPLTTISAPKPRIEKASRAIERLTKDMGEEALRLSTGKKDIQAENVGRSIGKYALVATDGSRALLVKGAKKRRLREWLCSKLPAAENIYATIDDPNLYLAAKRMAIVTSDQESGRVVNMTFWSDRQEIELQAESSDCEFSGRETVPAKVLRTGTVTLSAKYLISALGVWPVDIHLEDTNSPVSFAPKGKQIIVVIAQCRK